MKNKIVSKFLKQSVQQPVVELNYPALAGRTVLGR